VQTVESKPDAASVQDRTVTGPPHRSPADERSASADRHDDSHGSAHDKDGSGQASASSIQAAASSVTADSTQATPSQAQEASSISTAPLGSAEPVAASLLAAPASDLATMSTVPASPVSQLAPALLTLSTGSDGTQQMSLRLQPEELGVVEVRIDRAPDGSARVNVTADNPDTLQMLSGAQSDLHKALDAAGISAGRTLTFALSAESRPLSGLADLPSRPVGDDGSAGQQSTGGGSGNATGQGGGTSGNAGGSMAGGGSSGGTAGGSSDGSHQGGQAWANYAQAFQTVTDQAAADADNATE
jgi:uncharacterized membrane protein YgcG